MKVTGDTKCNWCAWYSHQRIGIGTGGLGTSGDHLNYSNFEMDQNTEKSPGDLRKLSYEKSLKREINNNYNNN